MEWTEILEHEVPICEGLTSSPRPLAPLPSSATPPSRPPSPPPSPRHKTACTSHPRRAFCERQIVEFGRKDPNHTFVAGMKTMLMQHMCLRGEARREVEEKIVRVLDTVLASEQPPPLATHEVQAPLFPPSCRPPTPHPELKPPPRPRSAPPPRRRTPPSQGGMLPTPQKRSAKKPIHGQR